MTMPTAPGGPLRALGTTLLSLAVLVVPASSQPVNRTGTLQERGLTAADFPKLTQVGEGLYTWSDMHPSGRYVTNDLIVLTSEGVLVADGQSNPDATGKMVEAIGRLTSEPIRWVVVGSDHGDHRGGDSAFPPQATFIAHPTSKANLERTAANRRASQPPVRIPTETVADKRVLVLGGREIQILFAGRAHTGGDLMVWLPQDGVLFLSEIFSHRIFPSMRTAHPTEWLGVLDRAEAMDAEMNIPGHGFVDPAPVLKSELVEFHRAVKAVVEEATRLHGMGISAEAALARADWGVPANWNSAEQNAPVALQRVWDDLDGLLPQP